MAKFKKTSKRVKIRLLNGTKDNNPPSHMLKIIAMYLMCCGSLSVKIIGLSKKKTPKRVKIRLRNETRDNNTPSHML